MTAQRGRRRGRAWALGALVALLIAPGSPAAAAVPAPVPAPDWGPVQEVPPPGESHDLALSAVFPDGTLVAAWVDGNAEILRSTRTPGGEWTPPSTLPVPGVGALDAIAPRPDGSLQVAYTLASLAGGPSHRVQLWAADGTVGPLGPTNGADDYSLSGDAEGDVVAERLGGYDETDGFDRLLRYHDGRRWSPMPRLGADPGDVFVPGARDAVWAAGYDPEAGRLQLRRWTPGSGSWTSMWSRDYPPGHLRTPLVTGLDLAVGREGRVTLAFQERELGPTGATLRAVVRSRTGRWTPARVLQRLPEGEHRTLTAPVVAAAGRRAEIAWTASAPTLRGRRAVLVAQVGGGSADVLPLATVRSPRGLRDLSLDVDLRHDGDVLVTYRERHDDTPRLVGWSGPHDRLQRAILLDDVGGMRADSAHAAAGLAAVLSVVRGGRLLSNVLE